VTLFTYDNSDSVLLYVICRIHRLSFYPYLMDSRKFDSKLHSLFVIRDSKLSYLSIDIYNDLGNYWSEC